MDGLLVVDKPAGPTSHDVVARIRHALREGRAGHTGTLDPAASGVLPVLLGRATRLAQFLMSADKAYEATIRLGVATDTFDSAGRPVGPEHDGPFPTAAVIDRALDAFRGTFLQTPPAYSAKKIAGRRSYKTARAAARADVALDAPRPNAVQVTTHAVELTGVEGNRVDVRISCTGGFYVRSLAHDLGELLGVGAHLAALRRIQSGDRTLERAVQLEAVERDPEVARRSLVPLADVLAAAAVILTDEGVRRALHGRDIGPADVLAEPIERWPAAQSATRFRLLDARGDLVAIGEPANAPGLLHPCVVLV